MQRTDYLMLFACTHQMYSIFKLFTHHIDSWQIVDCVSNMQLFVATKNPDERLEVTFDGKFMVAQKTFGLIIARARVNSYRLTRK